MTSRRETEGVSRVGEAISVYLLCRQFTVHTTTTQFKTDQKRPLKALTAIEGVNRPKGSKSYFRRFLGLLGASTGLFRITALVALPPVDRLLAFGGCAAIGSRGCKWSRSDGVGLGGGYWHPSG